MCKRDSVIRSFATGTVVIQDLEIVPSHQALLAIIPGRGTLYTGL